MRLAPLIIILFFVLIAVLLYSLFFSESGINERNMIVESNKELLEENQRLMDENKKLSESIKQAQENPICILKILLVKNLTSLCLMRSS